jgi:hypothetical protein
MEIKIKLNPTYTITPVFSTKGRGKKKQDIFQYIDYRFNLNRAIAVKGIISKKTIEESIPFLEQMNVDFCEHVLDVIINEMIIQVNDMYEMKMIHKDFEEFVKEHKEIFNTNLNIY